MPQLATESFISQYFWLVITLSLLNFILVSNVIPNISLTLKARKFTPTYNDELQQNENTPVSLGIATINSNLFELGTGTGNGNGNGNDQYITTQIVTEPDLSSRKVELVFDDYSTYVTPNK